MDDDLKKIASQTSEQLLLQLKTDIDTGLSGREVVSRLKKYGLNIIPTHKKEGWSRDLLQQFKSPLTILLLIAAVISFSIAENINASIIILIVLASVLTDFFQERSAGNAAEKIEANRKKHCHCTS